MECWEFVNKYDVWDENEDQVFFLKEESSCLMRSCCANARELEISFQDMEGRELLRFDRPLKCMECPCDSCYPNWTQVCLNYFNINFNAKPTRVQYSGILCLSPQDNFCLGF